MHARDLDDTSRTCHANLVPPLASARASYLASKLTWRVCLVNLAPSASAFLHLFPLPSPPTFWRHPRPATVHSRTQRRKLLLWDPSNTMAASRGTILWLGSDRRLRSRVLITQRMISRSLTRSHSPLGSLPEAASTLPIFGDPTARDADISATSENISSANTSPLSSSALVPLSYVLPAPVAVHARAQHLVHLFQHQQRLALRHRPPRPPALSTSAHAMLTLTHNAAAPLHAQLPMLLGYPPMYLHMAPPGYERAPAIVWTI
ncbi:hypothetical protein GGX14DRAFT_568829 [Mycena pura]|uniref:Uncharacterized protein n=1 Tax=Mycena pura TaxID=153505 RepID=A0AAD6VC27_9AGAR|nr:hypothetical protein GGX14DRAFT_568829 [Mycena pura]